VHLPHPRNTTPICERLTAKKGNWKQYLTIQSNNGSVGDCQKMSFSLQLILQAFSLSHMNVASKSAGLWSEITECTLIFGTYIGKELPLQSNSMVMIISGRALVEG